MRRIVWAAAAVGLVALEVFVIVQVAQLIGWWVLPLLAFTSLVGAWLVKREGAKAWASLRDGLRAGEAPAGKLGDAAVVLAGGLLILVPGFVTDVVGALVVLPPSRPLVRRLLGAVFGGKIADLERAVPPTFGPTAGEQGPDGPPPDGDVVQGRVVDGRGGSGPQGPSHPVVPREE